MWCRKFLKRESVFIATALFQGLTCYSQTTPAEHPKDTPAGQSMHGEVFNEGPRQAAYLVPGSGKVRFPVTTKVELANQFVEQGVAHLHGFWYFEAERSFRQAASLDSDCAMAYWGMALANRDNEKRSKGFIAEAVKRKDKASKREQLYIEAWDRYWKTEKKKDRAERYARDLEKILLDYPDDLEAKAFLILQLWMNRDSEVPISSYLAIDALLDQVFVADPMHPAHHFRIHLWDYEKPERALTSAARCGQSAPGIAHMWHMPGHTYSRLKRYDDACWQQEASARVDHAHMMRDRILPDQIHNFAHNNEWLIRNLNFVGRVRDAVELAKNMVELPRHPKYNHLGKNGSYKFGRQRLFETLEKYELWSEMLALAESPFLDPTDDSTEQIKRLRKIGVANYRSGNAERAAQVLADLQKQYTSEKEGSDKAVAEALAKVEKELHDKAESDKTAIEKAKDEARSKARTEGKDEKGIEEAVSAAEKKANEEIEKKKKEKSDQAKKSAEKPFEEKVRQLEKAVQELEGHEAVAAGDFKKGLELLKKAGGVEDSYVALVTLQAGDTDEAIKAIQKMVDARGNEVHPLAAKVDILWRAGKKEDAKKALQQLVAISNSIDLQSPVFTRISPIARELGFPEDWRARKTPATDVGNRPSLESLGPFRWRPSPAQPWALADSSGQQHSLRDYYGRPIILIFYLGYGCLHCVDQLKAFAAEAQSFSNAGFALVAVSTDSPQDLQNAIKNYTTGPFPITLLSDEKHEVFKRYRVFDDFEKKPLHGTFVIDAQGLVRWQDINFEPFSDAKFVAKEARRLLQQGAPISLTPAIEAPQLTSE